jgi:hypothetical protein
MGYIVSMFFEGKWVEYIITEKKHITQKYLLLKDRKIMIQRATDRTFYITKDSNYTERYVPLESIIRIKDLDKMTNNLYTSCIEGSKFNIQYPQVVVPYEHPINS